jgi:hypothetical protein
MPNYQDGQIYTIRCRTDNTLIYVGSTTMTLSRRMAYHRIRGKTSKTRFYSCVNGNWDNWYIELYEVYPCENKQELCKREGEIIRDIGTLNSKISGITQQESDKLSYEKHREKILEVLRQYRIDNPDKIKLANQKCHQKHREERLEVSRQYNINNNEKRKEYKKKYREEHKEEISAKRIAYYHEVQSKNKEYLNMKAREYYIRKKTKSKEETDIIPLMNELKV